MGYWRKFTKYIVFLRFYTPTNVPTKLFLFFGGFLVFCRFSEGGIKVMGIASKAFCRGCLEAQKTTTFSPKILPVCKFLSHAIAY